MDFTWLSSEQLCGIADRMGRDDLATALRRSNMARHQVVSLLQVLNPVRFEFEAGRVRMPTRYFDHGEI